MSLYCTVHHNANVCRASMSECFVQNVRRPDQRTPMKVLVKTTFHFVDEIWEMYIRIKFADIR